MPWIYLALFLLIVLPLCLGVMHGFDRLWDAVVRRLSR